MNVCFSRESFPGCYRALIGDCSRFLSVCRREFTAAPDFSFDAPKILLPCDLYFLAQHNDMLRGADAQLYLGSSGVEDFNFNVVADQQRLARAPPDYEHMAFLWE